MERKMRNQILDEIMELVAKLRDEESVSPPTTPKPMEMLTVKEAAALVKGVSEHIIFVPARENEERFLSARNRCLITSTAEVKFAVHFLPRIWHISDFIY